MPEVAATVRPIAVRVLRTTFAYRPRTGPPFGPRVERMSTIAHATSNAGYSTSSVALSGPRVSAVVNSSAAQTAANPKRRKYSLLSVAAAVGGVGRVRGAGRCAGAVGTMGLPFVTR
ncbi:hypothetical protein SCALM49S_03109 [Streptomyces californicus]